ncbi:hypothetical protein sos41_31710 [Alphaproteobacteria bacterium SO-S41]|nr:hypothetical protein sos41_31710 [Alphaproteobacteria bacterium SO-S41]
MPKFAIELTGHCGAWLSLRRFDQDAAIDDAVEFWLTDNYAAVVIRRGGKVLWQMPQAAGPGRLI